MYLVNSSLNLKHKLPHLCYMEKCPRRPPHHRCQISLFSQANQSVAAVVLEDGSRDHWKQLYPLTNRRSEGAIPIGGSYRLIDAVVSNCINSDITKIYALTQFNSTSLNSHLSKAYSAPSLSKDAFVQVIAACQSPQGNGWFQGSADAIRRCLLVLEEYPEVTEILILPGHHLYKMDYGKLIDAHKRSKADITISVMTCGRTMDFRDLGSAIFKQSSENGGNNNDDDDDNNPDIIIRTTTALNSIPVENMMGNFEEEKSNYLMGMGIYVINRNIMIQLLTQHFPTAHDLKTQVIPGAISLGMKIHGYMFDGYWEDMRSIGAYYRANMEMIRRTNDDAYSFYDRESPLYTLPRHLPPSLIADAVISDSIIGDGCLLSRCRITGSVLGMRTRISDGAVIEDSVIMGSETYNHQIGTSDGDGVDIPIGIGEGSHVRKAIVDKNARIGRNVMIINKDNVQESNMESKGYFITGGIIVIIRNAVIPDGSIL